jgi:hypothetical protein
VAPIAEPVTFEPIAPIEAVAPIAEPVTFETVGQIDAVGQLETVARVETDAPLAHYEPTPFTVEPTAEIATDQVAAIAEKPEAQAPVEHYEPAPLAVEPVTEIATEQVAEIADVSETETVQEVETAQTTRFRVVIRLSGAEPVEAGAFNAVGEAKDRAFEIVGQLTSEDGSWPYFRGRYLRPDAIVSVDIVEETAW